VTGFSNGEGAQDQSTVTTQSSEHLQSYAALKMFDVMKTPSIHEAMVKIGAYVLSEFGYLIADQAGKGFSHQFHLI
jgi:AP-2 complex subunit alpha